MPKLQRQLAIWARHGDLPQLQKYHQETGTSRCRAQVENGVDIRGNAAIHWAASAGHVSFLDYLLTQLGVDPSLRNFYGWTALSLAVVHRQPAVLRYLLEFEKEMPNDHLILEKTNAFGYTALMLAVADGSLEMVYQLLNAGANVNYRSGEYGMTALMLAAFKANYVMVNTLLSNGAEVNAQNRFNGWTALMYAAIRPTNHSSRADTEDIIQVLMEYGADPMVKNHTGRTCFDLATDRQNELFLETVNQFIETQSQPSSSKRSSSRPGRVTGHPIFNAIIRRNRPVLLFLISSDPKCTEVIDSVSGFTPLMCAVAQDDRTSLKILIDYGADVNRRNQFSGWTALMYAVYYHHFNIVKYLLDHGADPTIRGRMIDEQDPISISDDDSQMISARDIADMNGEIDLVQIFDRYSTGGPPVTEFKFERPQISLDIKKLAFWKTNAFKRHVIPHAPILKLGKLKAWKQQLRKPFTAIKSKLSPSDSAYDSRMTPSAPDSPAPQDLPVMQTERRLSSNSLNHTSNHLFRAFRSKSEAVPFPSESPFLSSLAENDMTAHERNLVGSLNDSFHKKSSSKNPIHNPSMIDSPRRVPSKPTHPGPIPQEPTDTLLALLTELQRTPSIGPLLVHLYRTTLERHVEAFMVAQTEEEVMRLGVAREHVLPVLLALGHVRRSEMLERIQRMKIET